MSHPSTPLVQVTSVSAPELLEAFDAHAAAIDVLSLDCFDTLLWRRTALPTDVFYDLQHAPKSRDYGLSPVLRIRGESAARSMSRLRQGRGEVNLQDIYRALFPDSPDEDVSQLIQEELAAEKRACFGFPPAIQLIRKARARGIRVVIASDTYFKSTELRELLASTLPADVVEAIEHIFCSCEVGRSKGDGLLTSMLDTLRLRPERVLHVGDNAQADAESACRAKMRALHLRHQTPIREEILRNCVNIAGLLLPGLRATEGTPSPMHPVFAAADSDPNPADILGALGAGPILYAFARFVLDEVEALRARGKRPRVLFLMRDAYLPQQVCNALAGENVGHAVALSRFASNAASFRSRKDIELYLARSAGSARFKDMARQLLLPQALANSIVLKAEARHHSTDEFVRRILNPNTVQVIIRESAKYRQRLYSYLKKQSGIESGDTLVLVDLGYEGTAQRQLQAIFEEELGVEVEGRYLIVVRTPNWERSRKGLIDPSWCDDRAIFTLVPYVALLEDLCTSNDGSVVDYTDSGDVVSASRVLQEEQYARIRPVQSACIQFCRRAQEFFQDVGSSPSLEDLRRFAVGAIGRLLFAPTEAEVAYLEGFRLDMNLATVDSFALFDRQAGLAGLRRRGLFFMEKNLKTLRMNYPIEVRAAGMELGVTLLAQHRYGLTFAQSDLNLRRETIGILVVHGPEAGTTRSDAMATHDGFYSLVVPVGDGSIDIGILMAQRYRWFELDSVQILPTASLLSDHESLDAHDITESVYFEGIERRSQRIFECSSPSGFMFVRPEVPRVGAAIGRTYACRVVFRPLELREPAESERARSAKVNEGFRESLAPSSMASSPEEASS